MKAGFGVQRVEQGNLSSDRNSPVTHCRDGLRNLLKAGGSLVCRGEQTAASGNRHPGWTRAAYEKRLDSGLTSFVT